MEDQQTNTGVKDASPLRKMAADGVAYLCRRDLQRLGVVSNKTTLNRWIGAGRFPRPFYPEARSPRWPIEAVLEWHDRMTGAARGE